MALVAAGLAVPHGRGGHHAYYLSSEGLRLRAALADPRAARPAAGEAPAAPAPGGGFVADDGTGAAAPSARRAAEVAAAWEGLLQIRSVLMDGATDVPAPWERERCVHAVALALEAARCPPARPGAEGSGDCAGSPGAAGYTVAAGPHPGTARITWSPPTEAAGTLPRIARLLAPHGWQCTEHRERDASAYLLASPRR